MQSPPQQNCDEYGRLAIAKTMPQRRSYGSPAAHSPPCETLQRKHSLSPRLPQRNRSEDSFFNNIASDCFSLPEEENSHFDDYSSASSTFAASFPISTIVCSHRQFLKEEDDITASDTSSLVSCDDNAGRYREERWNTPNRELVYAAAAPRRLPSSSQRRHQQLVRAHSCNATTSKNLHLRRDCFPVKPIRLRSTSQELVLHNRRPTSFSGIIAEGFVEKRTN